MSSTKLQYSQQDQLDSPEEKNHQEGLEKGCPGRITVIVRNFAQVFTDNHTKSKSYLSDF